MDIFTMKILLLQWITIYCLSTTRAQVPIRLVGGPDKLSGRLEVFIQGNWSTVCDDSWDINDANVVCRQLGHGTAKQADAHFGKGTGLIAFEGVDCVGDEQYFDNCSHEGLNNHDCVHDEDVGVVCNSNAYVDVRLESGLTRYEGRVEVNYNGKWGTVCSDDWGLEEATVVCRQLGLGPAFAAKTGAYFGPGTGEIFLDDVGCVGDEDKLGDCNHYEWGNHDCTHDEDAGVICNGTLGTEGEIRLVGGITPNEGRVEIYHAGEWGTVCDDLWNTDDANVVCAQLGFDPAVGSASLAKTGAHFGQGSGNIWLDELKCAGTEVYLSDCPNAGWRQHDCSHSEDAGVVCNVQITEHNLIRLVGGMRPSEGRVEIFHDGEWGTICDDSWDLVNANVACRQLGYTRAIAVKSDAYFGPGDGSILLDDVQCTGEEDRLHDCASKGWAVHDCGHIEDAGVVCGNYSDIKITVQLFDKDEVGTTMGRVEVLHDGIWGTVCDDRFDLADAEVICNQLGYPGADHWYIYGDGSTSPILLTNIECGGTESNLGECARSNWNPDNCVHNEDVGVVCNQDPSSSSGTFPIFIIVAISVGAIIIFLIILTVLIIVCCYCCSRKKTESISNDDDTNTKDMIPPPNRQSVPLEEFHGKHSFMFVTTPNGVQMVTPERPGSYVAETPPRTMLYQDEKPAIYTPPLEEKFSVVGGYHPLNSTANESSMYQGLGLHSTPIRDQNGSLPQSMDHNGNRSNAVPNIGPSNSDNGPSSYSQHDLSYEKTSMQLNVPITETTSNYVGADDDSEEYTYINPLQVCDETDNNVANNQTEVKEMLV